jgi:anti-sigma regulatory factor (Ser/Thr protein kinase)
MRSTHSPAPPEFAGRELRLPADARELARARDYVSTAAREFGLADGERIHLVFAANEAVTNAIRHGRPDAEGTIRLEVAAEDDALIVTVSDFGSFVSCAPSRDPMAEGGRGFTFITGLIDQVQLTTRERRTTVRLYQRRGSPAAEEEVG